MSRIPRLAWAGVLLAATVAVAQPAPTPDLLPVDVRTRFQTSDLDRSDSLTRDEAIKGGFASSAFAAVDRDGDQLVTLEEIGRWFGERAQEWTRADRDDDGVISREEAQSSPTLRSAFSTADRDNDGLLRRQEHEAWNQTTLMQNVDLPVVVPNIINRKF